MLLPGVSIFLDVDEGGSNKYQLLRSPLISRISRYLQVDDLESIDELEEYIEGSQVIMIFASKGYFKSDNCLREARTAVEKAKPLTLMHDPVRGGATLEFIQQEECPVELLGLFEGRKIIEWHRIKDFQLVSLKLLVAELLLACPGYDKQYDASFRNEEEAQLPDVSRREGKMLYADIYVPGEITETPLKFKEEVRIYASANNPGAREVVEVFQKRMAVEVCFAPPPMATHFLLYLAHETFVGEAGEKLAEEVRHMLQQDLPIVMLHENDMRNGGCEFVRFFSTTPQDLIVDGLYKALALAYYPGHFRPVSLALVAKKLGAVSRRGMRSWRNSLSFSRADGMSEASVVVAAPKKRRPTKDSNTTTPPVNSYTEEGERAGADSGSV